MFFVFKPKTAYEMRISDWSSDVCSSDLPALEARLVINAADSLPSALRSVRGQSLREIEVIIADDGSSDGTAAVAAAAEREDPRVRLLAGSRNRGAAAADRKSTRLNSSH